MPTHPQQQTQDGPQVGEDPQAARACGGAPPKRWIPARCSALAAPVGAARSRVALRETGPVTDGARGPEASAHSGVGGPPRRGALEHRTRSEDPVGPEATGAPTPIAHRGTAAGREVGSIPAPRAAALPRPHPRRAS